MDSVKQDALTSTISIENFGEVQSKVELLAGHTLFFIVNNQAIKTGSLVYYDHKYFKIEKIRQHEAGLIVLITKAP